MGFGVHRHGLTVDLCSPQAVPPAAVDGSSYQRPTVLEGGATLAGSGHDLKARGLSPGRI